MENHPKVSVIIPSYNQAKFINQCLDSIAAQTYFGEIEVIVVDDGSPDESVEIAKAHALNPIVISQENTGVSGARNRGIDASSGSYIAFLDADDLWTPEKLSQQIGLLDKLGEPGLSFTRYKRIHADGSIPDEPLHPWLDLEPNIQKLVNQNFIGCSTVIVHRDCINKVGKFPTDSILQKVGQDYALWLRIAAYFPMIYLPLIGTFYTVHKTNRVGTDPLKHFNGGLNAIKSFYDWSQGNFQSLVGQTYKIVVLKRLVKFLFDQFYRNKINLNTFSQSLRFTFLHLS